MTLSAGLLMAGNFTLTSSDLQGQLTKKQEFDGLGAVGRISLRSLAGRMHPKGLKVLL